MKRPFLEVVSSEPDAELERVFAAARELAEPAPESRARVLSALHAALPGPAPSGVQLRPSPPLPEALGGRAAPRGVQRLIAGGAVIAALSFGLGHVVGHARGLAEAALAEGRREAGPGTRQPSGAGAVRAASPAELPAAEPPAAEPLLAPAAAPEAAEAAEAPEASDRPPGPRQSARPARRRSSAPRQSEGARGIGFREVLDQLRRAQEQLRLGHATMSLLLLSELDRKAGDLLLEERETTRVLALCASGQQPAARAAARALSARSPRSIYAQRLSASCAAEGRGD